MRRILGVASRLINAMTTLAAMPIRHERRGHEGTGMDLKQIETFVRVAELGSFTRAAGLLRIAQPALSRQVRALEVELRQPLFDRNGRGVALTEAGQRLLAHGRGILQQVERAKQDLEELRGVPAGKLALGVPPSIGRAFTAPIVEAFRTRFPRATLSVVEGLSTYVLEWLAQGRVDCAVVYNATPSPLFEIDVVLDERLYLVARSDGVRRAAKTASLAEVAAAELVIPSRPHAIRMRLETALAKAGLKPRIGLEVDSVPAILDLVSRHPLQAVLPMNAIRGSGRGAEFRLRPIGPPVLSTTLWIATSAQRPRGPLLDESVTLVAELLRGLLAEDRSPDRDADAGAPTPARSSRRARPRPSA
jgi:LysR family nitrogen assimilation transcriptional regulator